MDWQKYEPTESCMVVSANVSFGKNTMKLPEDFKPDEGFNFAFSAQMKIGPDGYTYCDPELKVRPDHALYIVGTARHLNDDEMRKAIAEDKAKIEAQIAQSTAPGKDALEFRDTLNIMDDIYRAPQEEADYLQKMGFLKAKAENVQFRTRILHGAHPFVK